MPVCHTTCSSLCMDPTRATTLFALKAAMRVAQLLADIAVVDVSREALDLLQLRAPRAIIRTHQQARYPLHLHNASEAEVLLFIICMGPSSSAQEVI
jgi:hypothetical protein